MCIEIHSHRASTKLHYSVEFLHALCLFRHFLIFVSSKQSELQKRVTEKMWLFSRKGESGFSSSSTAEEVTRGIDGNGLVAVVTGQSKWVDVEILEVDYGIREQRQTWQKFVLFLTKMNIIFNNQTGVSSGIGTETARVLALHGVHVVMAVRNLTAGRDVKDGIIKEIPTAKVDVFELDLSSLASVRKFASEFTSQELPLNILINNAGVMACPYTLSKDGIEMQFATNHLGHFLLTELLLENMKNTAQKSNIEGRIVNVSSEGHRLTYREGIRFDKINDKSGYSSFPAYGQSKLCNILHANELDRRLKEEGAKITANSLHPGAIVTNLLRHQGFLNTLSTTLGKYVLKDIPQGAATTCYVALHPQVCGVGGKYFKDSNIATPSSHATDTELAKKLWDFSLDLI